MVADAEEGGTVRINLRLPANLKQRAEAAPSSRTLRATSRSAKPVETPGCRKGTRSLFSRDSGI